VWGPFGGSARGSECPGTVARPPGRWGQGRRWHRGNGAQCVLEGVDGVVVWDASRCIAVRRRLERVWTRWSLFLPGQARSKSRWRPLLVAGEGRQGIEESGYTRFESGTSLKTGWKIRSVRMHIGGHTFVNAATNARDVKRGRFAPVHHLWFGSSQRPRRGRIPWVFFRGVLWGVLLRYIVSIGLQRVSVCDMSPGARL